MDMTYDVETRRMKGCCLDCGRKYGDEFGFPDLVVSPDVWKIISPTGDEGGLLCPSCMCRRAADAGLSNIPAVFRSGPFCTDSKYLAAPAGAPPNQAPALSEIEPDECK